MPKRRKKTILAARTTGRGSGDEDHFAIVWNREKKGEVIKSIKIRVHNKGGKSEIETAEKTCKERQREPEREWKTEKRHICALNLLNIAHFYFQHRSSSSGSITTKTWCIFALDCWLFPLSLSLFHCPIGWIFVGHLFVVFAFKRSTDSDWLFYGFSGWSINWS